VSVAGAVLCTPMNATAGQFLTQGSTEVLSPSPSIGRLHFGRYGGLPMKTAWAVLGLVPPALFVTGAIMWWHRVVRPR
jgi:uncharacterized iron-regulated membrane protein